MSTDPTQQLVVATLRGDAAAVQAAIAAGADVHSGDRQTSLLTRALLSQQFKIAEALLNHGARLDARDQSGKTPLHWLAMLADSAASPRWLLRYPHTVNVADADGRPPLLLAAATALPQLVTVLVAAGHHVEGRDTRGWSVLHAACALRQDEDAKEITPYRKDLYTAQIEVVRYLLDHGARPDAVTHAGTTVQQRIPPNSEQVLRSMLAAAQARREVDTLIAQSDAEAGAKPKRAQAKGRAATRTAGASSA